MKFDKTSFIITLFVLLVLVMASPTQAVFLNIQDAPDTVKLGDKFEFNAEVDPQGEKLEMISVDVLAKEDGEEVICMFTAKGKRITADEACKGIKVKKAENEKHDDDEDDEENETDDADDDDHDYGYGYGGDEQSEFRVRVETNKGFVKEHGVGNYSFTLTAYTDEGNYSSSPKDVVVTYPCEKVRIGNKWIDIDDLEAHGYELSDIEHDDKTHNCIISQKEHDDDDHEDGNSNGHNDESDDNDDEDSNGNGQNNGHNGNDNGSHGNNSGNGNGQGNNGNNGNQDNGKGKK